MTFPSNPADQQTATISGIIYQYNSADNSWTKTGNVSAFSVEGNLTVNGSVLSTSVYADQYFFSNGTPFISGGGGTSANAWTIITANYTATSGDRLFANTALGEITVTLPSAPVQGDTIQIVDAYNFATNSLIVNPGTNTIEGYGSELEVDIAAVDLEFVYAENTWQLISSVGPQGIQGNTGYTGSQGQQGIAGYTGSAGADGISGYTGSAGLSDWETISGNYTAVNRDRLLLNSSGGSFNVTLPATPALGTYIQLTDAASLTANPVTIIANGSNIEGDPSDLILDVANATFEFIYDGTNWQVTSTAGPRGYVGSAGTLGYTGSAGTDGIIGQDGYTGSQGVIGPTGYTGSAGTDGIIGQDGYTGSQGDLGYTGSQGDQGTSGYTGSQGETGLGFAIAKSYNSVAALSADTSPTGITAGQFAIIETGDVEDPENSRLYLWNGTVYSYISDLSGNIGLTGPQGTIGYTGSAGSLGYTGSQGIAGYVGSQGIVSYTVSATAPTSPENGELWYDSSTDILYVYVNDSVSSYWLDISTGVPGPSGYTGSAGPLLDAWTKQTANYVASSGNRIIADTSAGAFDITLPASPSTGDYVIITDGYNFSTNSITILNNGSTIEGQSSNVVINVGSVDLEFVYDGATWQIISTSGPTGYTGSRGQDGTIGVDGYTGSQGDIGYTGSRGQDGTIGVDGYTGSQGQQGNIGYTGSQGIQGDIGYTGSRGQDGTIGVDGYTGSQGDIGYTGSQGQQGDIGAIGYTGSQGLLGYTGSIGDTGSTGSQGYTGSAGQDGILGQDGYTGSQGFGYVTVSTRTYTGDGTANSFTVTSGLDANSVVVTENGVVQTPDSDYSINANVLIFTTAPASNVAIQIREFVNTPGIGYSGSQGYTGSQGAGYTGSQGDLGYTGSAGQNGTIGVDGYTGSQGIQGNIGYTGSQGIIGYTGSQGIIGGVTYNVTNSGTSAYVILGENNPNITLARGITYYFDINASGHPFWIKTAQTTGNLDAYTSGVTNNGVDIGVVTFTVPLDAPSTLYYICQFHASMVGTFTIRNIGELGYTGSQGLIGYTGSQGIQGTEGNIGPIGYTGSAGTGGGGGEGYTGSQGLPGALASSQYLDTFTGNGVQTAFTLSVAPVGVNQTTVTIDGITQIRSSYTLSGPVLTFIEAPALDDTIEVVSVLYGTTSFVDRQYTGNGAVTTFTVTDGVTANSVLVMDNGLVQRPGVDYNISGNVVVFAEAPADQNAISIRELPAGAVGYTGSAGTGGSAGDILSPFLLMGG